MKRKMLKMICLFLIVSLPFEFNINKVNCVTRCKDFASFVKIFESIVEFEKPSFEEKFIFENIQLKNEYNGLNKSYMDLDCINYVDSKQFEMKSSYLLDEKGHYFYEFNGEKFYVIALGKYFGKVGDMFKIQLSNGNVFYAIKGDEKKIDDTYENYAHKEDYSVIEFIINKNIAINYYGSDNGYVCNGNLNNNELWNGTIISVEKIIEVI